MTTRLPQGLRFAAIGSAPGLLLIAIATFFLQGEVELPVGAPGILVAVFGGVVGFGYGLLRHPPTSVD